MTDHSTKFCILFLVLIKILQSNIKGYVGRKLSACPAFTFAFLGSDELNRFYDLIGHCRCLISEELACLIFIMMEIKKCGDIVFFTIIYWHSAGRVVMHNRILPFGPSTLLYPLICTSVLSTFILYFFLSLDFHYLLYPL